MAVNHSVVKDGLTFTGQAGVCRDLCPAAQAVVGNLLVKESRGVPAHLHFI